MHTLQHKLPSYGRHACYALIMHKKRRINQFPSLITSCMQTQNSKPGYRMICYHIIIIKCTSNIALWSLYFNINLYLYLCACVWTLWFCTKVSNQAKQLRSSSLLLWHDFFRFQFIQGENMKLTPHLILSLEF